ncbi:MAG: F0F1 ATP synthase subunit B, partial [Marinoscillum sp.]
MVTPEIGLIIWQTIVFLVVFGILAVFVWKPIASALKTREGQIEDALRAADLAKEEMEQVKADNEFLLQEARAERDKMLKEATDIAKKIREDAKNDTVTITNKMIEDAKTTISSEKK